MKRLPEIKFFVILSESETESIPDYITCSVKVRVSEHEPFYLIACTLLKQGQTLLSMKYTEFFYEVPSELH